MNVLVYNILNAFEFCLYFIQGGIPEMDMKVTKDTLIGDMLVMDRGIAVILMQSGMHCVGCPSSAGETLDEACAVHGMDTDKVLADINEYLANK